MRGQFADLSFPRLYFVDAMLSLALTAPAAWNLWFKKIFRTTSFYSAPLLRRLAENSCAGDSRTMAKSEKTETKAKELKEKLFSVKKNAAAVMSEAELKKCDKFCELCAVDVMLHLAFKVPKRRLCRF